MATLKSIKQTPKAAQAAEVHIDMTELPITRANDISDRIHRQLTQLKGICALIGVADMSLEIANKDDLQAAMCGVQDLIERIEHDYDKFYAIARAEMVKEVAHGS